MEGVMAGQCCYFSIFVCHILSADIPCATNQNCGLKLFSGPGSEMSDASR